MIAACTVGALPGDISAGQTIVFAIIILLLGVPCAFRINYQRLYNQSKKPNISLLFFALQGLFIIANVIVLVGFEDSGCMGLIIALSAFDTKVVGFPKFAMVFAAVLAGASTAFQCMLFGKVMILFKSTGTYAGGAAQQAI
jgi:hypothetical protein